MLVIPPRDKRRSREAWISVSSLLNFSHPFGFVHATHFFSSFFPSATSTSITRISTLITCDVIKEESTVFCFFLVRSKIVPTQFTVINERVLYCSIARDIKVFIGRAARCSRYMAECVIIGESLCLIYCGKVRVTCPHLTCPLSRAVKQESNG